MSVGTSEESKTIIERADEGEVTPLQIGAEIVEEHPPSSIGIVGLGL